MWPFTQNRYPYTDFHELNLDWILHKITELDYKVKTWMRNITPTITETVNKWLDDHPEATTTVQDGSLTENKFTSTLKLKTIKDYVTPEMFGAVGDGVADDTVAVESALNYVANRSNKEQILFIGRKYKITRTMVVETTNEDLCFNMLGASKYTFGDSGNIYFAPDNRESDIPMITTSKASFKHITLKDVYFSRRRSTNEVNNIYALYGTCFDKPINEGVIDNCSFVGWNVVFKGIGITSVNACSFTLNNKCFTGGINGTAVVGGNFFQNRNIIYGRNNIASISFIGSWIEETVNLLDFGARQALSVNFINCDIRSQTEGTIQPAELIKITSSTWQRYHINFENSNVYWDGEIVTVSNSGVVNVYLSLINCLMIGLLNSLLDSSVSIYGNSMFFNRDFTRINTFTNTGFDFNSGNAISPIGLPPRFSTNSPMKFGRRSPTSNRVDYMDTNLQTMTWLPVYRATSQNDPINPAMSHYFILNDDPQNYGDFIFRYVNNNLEGKKIYDLVTYDEA